MWPDAANWRTRYAISHEAPSFLLTHAPLLLSIHPAVFARLRSNSISGEDVVGALIAVSEVAAEKMGGTSGALYS